MFKQRKHKTFNYQPRFSKQNQVEQEDRDKSEVEDFVSKWKENRNGKRKVKSVMSMKILILVLVLLLICMYVLEKKYM